MTENKHVVPDMWFDEKTMTTNIVPNANVLIIYPKQLEEREGRIYIPEDARGRDQARITEGHIVSMGETVQLDEGYAVGDYIIYADYATKEIKISGHTLVVIRDVDVIAKVDSAFSQRKVA